VSGDRPSEVPEEYSEAYQRAYRRSLAEHPTELMSPARPGKRALEQSALGAQQARMASGLARLLSDSRGRLLVAIVLVLVLLVVAYGLGRVVG
jgi:hypothetical protein